MYGKIKKKKYWIHINIILAQQNGINPSNYDDLIEFLLTVDAHKLVSENHDELYPEGTADKKCDIIYSPTIECNSVYRIYH